MFYLLIEEPEEDEFTFKVKEFENENDAQKEAAINSFWQVPVQIIKGSKIPLNINIQRNIEKELEKELKLKEKKEKAIEKETLYQDYLNLKKIFGKNE